MESQGGQWIKHTGGELETTPERSQKRRTAMGQNNGGKDKGGDAERGRRRRRNDREGDDGEQGGVVGTEGGRKEVEGET